MSPAMIYELSQEASLEGELVVPIRQGEDPNLKSGGVCRAMTYEWGKARMKNLPWRGHSPASQRLPLIPNNAITKKFPWVNTRVAVTPDLQKLQDMNSGEMAKTMGVKMITQASGDALESPTVLFDNANDVCRGNFGICVLGISSHAPKAVSMVPKPVTGWQSAKPRQAPGWQPARPVQPSTNRQPLISQQRPVIGHALGFRITNSANEFFDANSGWYNFASAARLCQFFVRYIGITGYRQHYGGPWEMWSIV